MTSCCCRQTETCRQDYGNVPQYHPPSRPRVSAALPSREQLIYGLKIKESYHQQTRNYPAAKAQMSPLRLTTSTLSPCPFPTKIIIRGTSTTTPWISAKAAPSRGPDFVCLDEGMFCDMERKKVWTLSLPNRTTGCFDQTES